MFISYLPKCITIKGYHLIKDKELFDQALQGTYKTCMWLRQALCYLCITIRDFVSLWVKER